MVSQVKHSPEVIYDTDVEDTAMIHRAKKLKVDGSRYRHQPLRRTGKLLNYFKVNCLLVTYLRNNTRIDVDRSRAGARIGLA